MNSGIFLLAILLAGVAAVSAFPQGILTERHHGAGGGFTELGGWRPHRPFVPPFFWRPPFHRPTKRTTTTIQPAPTDSTEAAGTTGQPGVSTAEPVTATSPPDAPTTVEPISEPESTTL